MKCRKLLTTFALGAVLTLQPMPLFACGPGSSSDGGGQSSDNNDSNGNNGSNSGNNDSSNSTSSPSEAGFDSNSDTNGPSNYQLLDCSNPVFYDFMPCFEQMVKSRENFVSQPKGE